MSRQWLDGSEITKLFASWPDEACDLALELREFIQEIAPELSETIAFNALCYYKPDRPYGVIGGNVCLIAPRDDCLHLAFIHGAFLSDPEGLLQGRAKAKRQIPIRASANIRRAAFKDLIHAAIAYTPTGNDNQM